MKKPKLKFKDYWVNSKIRYINYEDFLLDEDMATNDQEYMINNYVYMDLDCDECEEIDSEDYDD